MNGDRGFRDRDRDMHPRDRDMRDRDRDMRGPRDRDVHMRDRDMHPRDREMRDRDMHPREREMRDREMRDRDRDRDYHRERGDRGDRGPRASLSTPATGINLVPATGANNAAASNGNANTSTNGFANGHANTNGSTVSRALADLPQVIAGGRLDTLLHTGILPELQPHYQRLREEEERLRVDLEAKQERLRRQLRQWDKMERESRSFELRSELSGQSLRRIAGDESGGQAF